MGQAGKTVFDPDQTREKLRVGHYDVRIHEIEDVDQGVGGEGFVEGGDGPAAGVAGGVGQREFERGAEKDAYWSCGAKGETIVAGKVAESEAELAGFCLDFRPAGSRSP